MSFLLFSTRWAPHLPQVPDEIVLVCPTHPHQMEWIPLLLLPHSSILSLPRDLASAVGLWASYCHPLFRSRGTALLFFVPTPCWTHSLLVHCKGLINVEWGHPDPCSSFPVSFSSNLARFPLRAQARAPCGYWLPLSNLAPALGKPGGPGSPCANLLQTGQ